MSVVREGLELMMWVKVYAVEIGSTIVCITFLCREAVKAIRELMKAIGK